MNETAEKTEVSAAEDILAETAAADGDIAQPVTGDTGKKEKKRRRRRKDIFNMSKDIRYRGPLSYRHLKILGWICIVISQISVAENIKQQTFGIGIPFFLDSTVMSLISALALPLLLISVFAFLLKKRDNYRNSIIIYGGLSLCIAGLFILVYERYMIGLAQQLFSEVRADAAAQLNDFLNSTEDYRGYLSFNIFIDLFLCTLVMFFLDYNPQKFFTGKKLYIFRALVILPMAYEVACIIIKVMATDHLITLPLWVSPFLTTKPPVSILMFLSIVRYIKLREKEFLDTGRTPEEFRQYIRTNRNSLQFSLHLIVIIIAYSIIDIIIMLALSVIHLAVMNYAMGAELNADNTIIAMTRVFEWGFGGTAFMIVLIPVVLLFSYTRSHKIPVIDTAIPFAGVAAIVIVYIDCGFELLMGVLGEIGKNLESITELLMLA